MILIDYVFRTGSGYYRQVFLEECKYTVKRKKISKYISVTVISSDSDEEDSSEKHSDEETSNEELKLKL